MTDINRLLLDAIEIARRAGEVHLSFFRGAGNLNIATKSGECDIVTAADKAAEHMIISAIHDLYPSHCILSEESGEVDAAQGQSEWQWVIDPLDGTTNFSQGLPIFSVSIGIKCGGVTQVAVVYAPYLQELFHAVRGEGAFLNGEPLRIANTKTSLRQCVVSTGFPVDNSTHPVNNVAEFSRVLPNVRAVRRYGSAAIDLCYVAAGHFDAYWEMHLHEWDVCAGELILTEAGAQCVRYRHDRLVSVAAASPTILPLLLHLIQP